MKCINFNQEVNEQSYGEFIENLSVFDFKEGDVLYLFIDSVGGDICFAKKIAKKIDDLKKEGVTVNTINDGKVYSSALIFYLFGTNKLANLDKNATFLVHKVKMPHEGVELSNIDKIKTDLEKYTEELEDIYRARGVSEEAIKHLASGNDLMVNSFDKMKEYGLADEIIGENKTKIIDSVINLFRNPKKEAKFSFQNKFEESEKLTNKQAMDEEVKTMLNENTEDFKEEITNKQQIINKQAMDEEFKTIMNGVSAALTKQGEMLGNLDERIRGMEEKYNTMAKMQPTQNAELTEEECMNFKNLFNKTSVMNHGKVKNVLHFKNKCNEGDWMMPMNERFEIEEDLEDEFLNLANGGKFMNSKKKAVNVVAPVIENKTDESFSSELINQITDDSAPVTRAQNKGEVTNHSGLDVKKAYDASLRYGGEFSRGTHNFTK